MHGDGTVGVLADLEEALQDRVARHRPVHEEHVEVIETGVRESPRVVDLLVEADNSRDVVLPEIREVSFRGVQRVTWQRGQGRVILRQRRKSYRVGFSVVFFWFRYS